jgi:hypothetical protein
MHARVAAPALLLLVLGSCRSVPATVEADDTPPPQPRAQGDDEPRFVDLFVSEDYGCAVAKDGVVWCWGDDPALHLERRAAGEAWQRATPVAGVSAAVKVDGDPHTTCAVLVDGQVSCWQRPGHRRRQGYAPELVPGVTDAVDVDVAGDDVCVRTRTGDVHCSTLRGEDRRQVASAAVDFAAGPRRACALDAEGGIWCWDWFAKHILEDCEGWAGTCEVGPSGELLMAKIPGAVEIGVGDAGGDVIVRLASGEILVEPPVGRELPLPVARYEPQPGAEHALALAFGEGHGCIVAAPPDGEAREVRCFMGNGWAQLGVGDSQAHAEAVRVPGLDDVVGVAASRTLSCALTRTGAACWGTRVSRSLFTATFEGPQVTATGVASVVVGFGYTCASMLDGRTLCWGSTGRRAFEQDPHGIFAAAQPRPLGLELGRVGLELGRLRRGEGYMALDEAGVLQWSSPAAPTFGDEREVLLRREGVTDFTAAEVPACCHIQRGALRCELDDERAWPVPKLRKPTAVTASADVICAIHDGGKLGCFRLPELPEDPSTLASPALVEIAGAVDLIHVRGDRWSTHPCFSTLDRAGAVRALCLDGKQLDLHDLGVVPLEPLSSFALTRVGLCGLTRAGAVACFDFSTREVTTHDIPEPVAIASDRNHFCVLSRDGTLTCMGDNRWGQLGVVPQSVVPAPLAIEFG